MNTSITPSPQAAPVVVSLLVAHLNDDDGETLLQGFRATDDTKSVFVEKDRDVFYVDYPDIIAVLETPEVKLSATARTITYGFSGKVDVKGIIRVFPEISELFGGKHRPWFLPSGYEDLFPQKCPFCKHHPYHLDPLGK